jgi:hypothetical protein
MLGNRAEREEGETKRERENEGGRETTTVERENGMGWREKMALVDLTIGLNQLLSIFSDVNQ